MRRLIWLALSIGVGVSVGCLDEQLPEQNISGTLTVPGSQAENAYDIGIVYLGLYSGWDSNSLGYPYPSTGPVVGDASAGDAFPYGGTTVGRFAFACYQVLKCEFITGRFTNFEEIISSYELTDEAGAPLTPEQMFDDCTFYYGFNSLEEFDFSGEELLDFARNDAGDWEASWQIVRAQPRDNSVLYAYADNDLTSCNPGDGSINRQPDAFVFREGTNFQDVLNFPVKYLTRGDFITSQPPSVEQDRLDGYELVLDYVFDE